MNKYANDFTTSVKTYYKELSKFKTLPKDVEIDLIGKAKHNNLKAKNKILTSNLKFVFNVAKQYKGQGVPLEDLISEGNLGLVKALDRFDESKNVKFISYAVWWIKQSMQDCVKRRRTQMSIEILKDDIKQKNKSNTSNSEDVLAENNEEKNKEIDIIESETISKQDEILNKLIEKLDKRAQFIIKSYYGIGLKKNMTLDEIGKKLNLSRERVRKIKEKNLQILRSDLLSSDNFNDLF